MKSVAYYNSLLIPLSKTVARFTICYCRICNHKLIKSESGNPKFCGM